MSTFSVGFAGVGPQESAIRRQQLDELDERASRSCQHAREPLHLQSSRRMLLYARRFDSILSSSAPNVAAIPRCSSIGGRQTGTSTQDIDRSGVAWSPRRRVVKSMHAVEGSEKGMPGSRALTVGSLDANKSSIARAE